MMLVQQSGAGALPLSNLAPNEFLPFFRRIEESVIFHGLSPVVVYWSTREVKWLLPESANFRTLSRDAFCVSMFSEERNDKQDEFCFLVHSQGISMVVYGNCSEDNANEGVYQCVGSIDPGIVKRAFAAMIPVWQFIDLPEANRLDDARAQVGNPVTAPHFVSGIRNDWPVVKQRLAGSSPPAPGTDLGRSCGVIQGAGSGSSLNNPTMVVRPGAEIQSPRALLLPGAEPAVPGQSNVPPPPPGRPMQTPAAAQAKSNSPVADAARALSQLIQDDSPAFNGRAAKSDADSAANKGRRIQLPGALDHDSAAMESQSAAAAPPAVAQSTLALPAPDLDQIVRSDDLQGDPSLLEEEFNFQGLTDSPHFKPPGGNGSGNGGNGGPTAKAASPAEKKKEQNRGIRELREVWTNITQEVRTVFAPDAQRIIRDTVSQLRISGDLPAILQMATEELTNLSNADRGLIWQVVDDQLVVTNEFAANGHYCFSDANLGAQETTAIVSEFLSRFPDESGSGVIAIPDTLQDSKLRRMSPTLAALIELGDARARLVAQIRSRGIFHGFIELQQSRNPREWSEQDGAVLQSVSEVLSLVVQQSFDLMRIEQEANEMKLVNEISGIFRESGGQRAQYTIEQSVNLFADHTGFTSAQVFLFSEEDSVLHPQISEKEHSEKIPLQQKQNPFIQVFESAKLKTINQEYSKRGDAVFGHDTAMIIPLMSEGERLGVLGLWKRKQGSPMLRPQDRELALTVAGNLASFIRADQAIAQIRQKSARESLINTVSEQIQQSLKEVNPILQTLVSQLADYFDLGLSAVSIYDVANEKFSEAQCSGSFMQDNPLLPHMAEQLFQSTLSSLSSGSILMMSPADVRNALGETVVDLPESMQLTMVCPLIQGTNLKGALCMVSLNEKAPGLHDMRMIQDLLNRVAVVIEHKELFEKVERQAITDPLTGLYNRRYFEEQLNKELDRHQRFGHACSFIILDLDHFKSVNDTLDHVNGDIALKHTSAIVKKCVRDVDTVGRFGGEEFVVLLPESDSNAAMVVAERICTTLRESCIEHFKSPACLQKIQEKLAEGKINEATATRLSEGRVTASVGVSTFPLDAQEKTRLIELADKYLFLAKGRGRNQVCSSKNDNGQGNPAPLAPAAPLALPSPQVQALLQPSAILPSKAGSALTQVSDFDLQSIAEHGILGMLGNIIKAIGTRDGYGDDRSPRAADYASRIAAALRLSKEHTTVISLAAVLNNLGKVIVDKEILGKKGPLSQDEWQQVESTPSIAAKILEPAKHLHRVATVVECYQEHWDGSGYPRGLKGDDIPLESRIISIVDAYVAMTSVRPYRAALSHSEAVAILQEGAGKDWDPRIVKLFLAILEKEGQ